MKTTWILVANNTQARIFKVTSPSSTLEEIKELSHAEGRLHDRDLTTDLPGKIKNAGGMGGHAFEQPTDPKKHEASNFVHHIVDHLVDAYNLGQFEQLLLVAEPSFLGLLREHLPETVKKRVCFELNKNLVTLSAAEIRQHLPEYLPSH
jgi:protein required for attachment to host cells